MQVAYGVERDVRQAHQAIYQLGNAGLTASAPEGFVVEENADISRLPARSPDRGEDGLRRSGDGRAVIDAYRHR